MALSYNYSTKVITADATATLRSVYSDIQENFDDAAQMDDQIPLRADTPTLYTLINGWTFSAGSIQYLTSAALQDDAGDNIWTNVQTLGSIVSGTTIYIEQNGSVVWTAGSTGHINMLLKTKDGGSEIDSQSFTVYARKFQQTYSQFSTTGGAIVSNCPLATAADPQLDISQVTIDAYTGTTITWGDTYKAAGDKEGTFTVTIATPAVFSMTGHGFAVGDRIQLATTGALPTGLSTSTYYYVISAGYGANSFQVSTSAGGAAVDTSGSQSGTHTVEIYEAPYSVVIDGGGYTLKQVYNWVQSELLKNADIDDGAGTKTGNITDELLSFTGNMITRQGVWVENFASADANKIKYTDSNNVLHTPPASVAITVTSTGGAGMENGRVAVYQLNAAYNAATFDPATDIAGTLLATTLNASGAASTTMTYVSDLYCLVRTRKAGYKPFEVGTTLTSAGLSVTALNEADTVYQA